MRRGNGCPVSRKSGICSKFSAALKLSLVTATRGRRSSFYGALRGRDGGGREGEWKQGRGRVGGRRERGRGRRRTGRGRERGEGERVTEGGRAREWRSGRGRRVREEVGFNHIHGSCLTPLFVCVIYLCWSFQQVTALGASWVSDLLLCSFCSSSSSFSSSSPSPLHPNQAYSFSFKIKYSYCR